MNNKKLFVASLPWSIDNAALGDFFSAYGTVVEAQVIMDRETGRSKGFGFVQFSDDTDLDSVVKETNGKELDGRKLVVNIARPKTY